MAVATALFLAVVVAVFAFWWRVGGWRVAAVLAVWGVLLVTVIPPRVPIGLFGGFALAAIAAWRLRPPPVWPVALQTMRVPVELVLYLAYRAGEIPVHMTFEGRNFDVLAGATAPLVAWALARKRLPRGVLVAWNVAGLALLANIIVLAVTAIPGPFFMHWPGPPNVLVTQAPFILLPGFIVPSALAGHLLSLRSRPHSPG